MNNKFFHFCLSLFGIFILISSTQAQDLIVTHHKDSIHCEIIKKTKHRLHFATYDVYDHPTDHSMSLHHIDTAIVNFFPNDPHHIHNSLSKEDSVQLKLYDKLFEAANREFGLTVSQGFMVYKSETRKSVPFAAHYLYYPKNHWGFGIDYQFFQYLKSNLNERLSRINNFHTFSVNTTLRESFPNHSSQDRTQVTAGFFSNLNQLSGQCVGIGQYVDIFDKNQRKWGITMGVQFKAYFLNQVDKNYFSEFQVAIGIKYRGIKHFNVTKTK